MPPLLIAVLGLCFLLPTAFGFNWSYPVAAQQCSSFTVDVTGSDIALITFPLRLLIVPVGPSPLAHEVRQVLEIFFPTGSLTVTFTLPYPTNSQFVGLVADASETSYNGIASTVLVLSSTDASCFDATKDAVSAFKFSLSPTDVAECEDVRIYWDPVAVLGTPSFLYVIPNVAFGPIPSGNIDTQLNLGTGFTWRPAILAGSNLIIVGGDSRGTGAGGFIRDTVTPGDPRRDVSGACVAPTTTRTTTSSTSTLLFTSSAFPSTSTSAAPAAAGAVVNVGAIVGGTIGGVAALGIFFYLLHFLLQKKPEPQAPSTVQQYVPNSPTSNPALYGAPVPSLMPTPPPQWGVVQEPPGHVPMQVTFTGQSATTAISGSGYHGSSWTGSPMQPTGQWNDSNANVIRPTSWDGRPSATL